MSVQDKENAIIAGLRENGCRITSQRRLLIDIILRDDCSSCKEIYYKAVKKDSSIGLATVYRMMKTLEDAGFLHRENRYRVDVNSAVA